MQVVGVIHENYRAPDNGSRDFRTLPKDIETMCETVEETPRLMGRNHSSADDEMTIKCAYRRNCRYMDNDNYRDWRQQLKDEKIRFWLESYQEFLQMRYYFDKGQGTFDTLDGNIPAEMLQPDKHGKVKDVTKKELWTLSRE